MNMLGVQGLDLSGLEYGQLSDCCEEHNESSVFIKIRGVSRVANELFNSQE